MKRLQIFWTNKRNFGPGKGELKSIGGIKESGEIWNLNIEKAIEGIYQGIWEFYLVEGHLQVPVGICRLSDSEFFLSSKGHGYLHNLLEELPEVSFFHTS